MGVGTYILSSSGLASSSYGAPSANESPKYFVQREIELQVKRGRYTPADTRVPATDTYFPRKKAGEVSGAVIIILAARAGGEDSMGAV